MFNKIMEQAIVALWEKQFPTDYEMRHIEEVIENLGFDYITHYRYNGDIAIGENIDFGKVYIENFTDGTEQCFDIYGSIYRPLY